MSEITSAGKSTLKHALGPGLILAAAAVGVSHLVQSTRAGADYGFALVWAVLLANFFKYPFLQYGPRYAIATRSSMVQGYRKLGKWAFWVFVIFTVGTMFAVQAAVTIVTASLAAELTGIALNPLLWSAIMLTICIAILFKGQYSALDSAIKVIMVVLTISTIIAVVVALLKTGTTDWSTSPEVWSVTGVSFLIALMGWMPIPIDGAAWHSLWTMERVKQTRHQPELKESLIDFNIGYIGAAFLSLIFLTLGALVMFGSEVEFAGSGSAFASQLISLYTETLGDWAYWIIIICAFTTMFSTTITVTDAYPRVSSEILRVIREDKDQNRSTSFFSNYRGLLILISLCSLFLLFITGSQFTFMVDFATTLSFLTAPVLAFLNYRLVTDHHINEEYQPKKWLRILSWGGIIFLSVFALIFIYWKFFVG
ncbi:Nramp family divalent metal transporter [Balneola sp. MJW-20]|uniref:Nramp family divalent metal transporter n=1 Tax=Gracilimonas aurantiaca TaxID=3234185 RepID=UPI0034666F18